MNTAQHPSIRTRAPVPATAREVAPSLAALDDNRARGSR